MERSPDELLASPPDLDRFLNTVLSRLRWATIAGLLVITVARPVTGRVDAPTWVLVAVFGVYNLGIQFARTRLPRLRSYAWVAVVDLPVAGVLYLLAGEPGGPLFVLFFLAVDSAAAIMSIRGTLMHTAASAGIAGVIDLVLMFFSPTSGDIRMIVARLMMLTLVAGGMAILARRLTMDLEARQAERQQAGRLEELDRLRVTFISNISHELRTPLTAARAGLGLLEVSVTERLRPDERELLANVRRNNERLTIYIDDLLSFNQFEAGTVRLERETLDLRAVITDSLSAVYPLILQKGQTLEIVLTEPLPYVGDSHQLEQVVVNVLANAQRHTPPGTRITISGASTAEEVGFTVSDNGPGIDAPELDAIFQRFHRLASEVEGAGLGLAIARRIIELHGGRMWAESTPGEGARFHVRLAHRSNGGEQ